MGRIGNIKHENYDPEKLEKILKIIDTAAKVGEQRYYEVFVDDLKVISRTCDPELLSTFSDYVDGNSERLTIYLYYGASKHSDTYNFYFKGIPTNKTQPQGLSGLIGAELESQQKDKILKEIRHEQLEKENEELKSRVEELEEELVKQQEYIEKAKSGKIDSYAEIGSAILLKAVSHPEVIKRLPFLGTFAGLGEAPKEETKDKKEEAEEQTATFKRKGDKTEEPPATQNNLSEADQALLAIFEELKKCLDQEQMGILIKMIISFAENPHAVKPTNKMLEEFLKNNPPQDNKAA